MNRRHGVAGALLVLLALPLLALAGYGVTRTGDGRSRLAPATETIPAPPSDRAAPTLLRRVARGLHALLPTPADTVPVASAADLRVKGAEAVGSPRRALPPPRRALPHRTADEVAPRGIQVMRSPVPVSLPTREQIDWTMRAEPTVALLSATAGSVSGDALDDDRAATVVVRVPASATAGVLPVGEATFMTASEAITVPIELVVTRIRRATVTSLRPAFAGMSGRRTTLGFEVRNGGNSTDTFTVRLETLPGWRTGAVPTLTLRPGEQRRVEVPLDVPTSAGTTAAYPQVRVYAGGLEIAASTLNLNVSSEEQADLRPGPDLGMAVASILGDTIGAMPVLGFELRGPVGHGITLTGRAAIATDPADVNYLGLSRAGIFLGGGFLSATAPGWNATVGSTGATVSDLAGIGVYGMGAAGGVTMGSVRTSALVVNSQQGNALSAAGQVEKRLTKGTVGIAASHLEDGFLIGRTLDAVGLQGMVSPWTGVKFNGEVAWRSFTGGEGLGLYASAQRATDRDFLAIAAGHAPGGSNAYARATNEVNVSGSRRLAERVAVRADGYYSVDEPIHGGNFASSGFSIAPTVALGRAMTLETEVRRNDYDSRSDGRGFGNGETQLTGTLHGLRGRTRWEVGANYATGDRTSDDDLLGLHSTQNYRRVGVNGGIGWTLSRVTLDLGGDYTRSEVASGYFPRQLRVTATASRIQVFNSLRLPTLAANVEYTTWFSNEQNAAIVARVGTEMMLTRDLALMVDVERNPLIRPTGTPTPWVAAVRLSKSLRLGWAFAEPKTRGLVYQDANGNGRRDPSEIGMPGVMVRRGSAATVTDGEGRYTFAGRDGDAPAIDPVSLPLGQVVGADSGAKVAGTELAVIPTAPLTIRLTAVPDSLGRRPTGSPDQIIVIARDEQGNEWTLRADAEGLVRFDALPPGKYTLGADFSGATERLRIAGEAPVIEIRPGMTLEPVALRYQLRPVRLFTGAAAGRNGR